VLGSLTERPIYSCRAHVATSFVIAARVIGREVFKGDLEFSGGQGSRFRSNDLLSSCIEVGFQFVGRACTEGRTGVFMGVSRPVRGKSRNIHTWVRTSYPDHRAWVHPSGEKRHAWYVCLFATQLCMGAQLCSGQACCDSRLCL
jgi:hypothetical protein